jgi:hypothetical protein
LRSISGTSARNRGDTKGLPAMPSLAVASGLLSSGGVSTFAAVRVFRPSSPSLCTDDNELGTDRAAVGGCRM